MRATLPPNEVIRTGFLLVDASNIDDETFAEPLPMLRCTPGTLTNADDLTPRLIDIAALSPAQQEDATAALLREAASSRPPAICAWLDSPLDAAALARHIARFLAGPGAEGSSVFWRYYDPRVFSLAMAVFLPAQKEALLGPIADWRFPWCQHWWTVPGPGREIDPLGGYKSAWPTSTQWRSLDHSDLVARVFVHIHDTHKALSAAAVLRYQRGIDLALIAGKQHLKLTETDELVEYALHSARYGDAFLRHPKLDTAWTDLAQGKTNWVDLQGLLDHHDYQKLNQEYQLQQTHMGAT
ncbi:MAG: DUF4123 domain-containing protein [Collimonas sp.]|uniref:DUF4123 domain-containing protein n=1 Tax=Collimonas sp. TaxID=1963772 RepID=UPI0032677B6E